MDTPGLFSHRDDASAGIVRRSEMNVTHLGDRVPNGVVDGAFADLAAFNVGDGDAQSKCDGGGSEHFVAVGDEQEQVGAQATKQVGETEDEGKIESLDLPYHATAFPIMLPGGKEKLVSGVVDKELGASYGRVLGF